MTLSYSERSKSALNPLGKKLLTLMEEKQTNLCLSADVTTSAQLLDLAEKLGPQIAVLKTHIDILNDFTPSVIEKLLQLQQKHNFLIFEDRKFADIGNTVKHQYKDGIYRISEWADIVNAHFILGPSIIDGLKSVGLLKGRALLLIAELSSKGNLAVGEYTQKTVEAARENAEFVMGFICQKKLTEDPGFIHMTPGVGLKTGGDGLGQQYFTPHNVIVERKCDVIIVGRAIVEASDPQAAGAQFRKLGWEAYLSTLE